MNQAMPMDLGESRADGDGEAQERPNLQGPAEHSLEWLAAWILQHKKSPATIMLKFQ
jgi:hypothetical protein